MKVLIVEDERPAARRLQQLLESQRPGLQVAGVLESVEQTVQWLREKPEPDLFFLDIQLADGLSFEIFQQAAIQSPVIFTTAYDQYTLRAFKLNSIDYLLKPIDPEELNNALKKFDRLFGRQQPFAPDAIQGLIQAFSQPNYKERFIIRAGQQLSYIRAEEIFYCYSEDGLVFAQMDGRKRHVIDYTLDQLDSMLNPRDFFRLNRKVIAHIQSIRKVEPYFNSRLALALHPSPSFDIIVSRDRVNDFKNWLDK